MAWTGLDQRQGKETLQTLLELLIEVETQDKIPGATSRGSYCDSSKSHPITAAGSDSALFKPGTLHEQPPRPKFIRKRIQTLFYHRTVRCCCLAARRCDRAHSVVYLSNLASCCRMDGWVDLRRNEWRNGRMQGMACVAGSRVMTMGHHLLVFCHTRGQGN